MTSHWLMFIGLCAACCTTLAFLPQVLKSYRTRNTRDLSLPMYSVLTVGLLLWLCYGVFLHDLPLILANAVSLILALNILILKIKYG